MKKYLIAVFAVILALGAFIICSQSMLLKLSDGDKTEIELSSHAWQEKYDLGVRYLSEGNYQEAILAFEAAIEIDPKRAEAYLGLADVYAATGDDNSAQNVLNRGYTATNDNAILERLASFSESPAEKINYNSIPIYNNGHFDYWIHWRQGNDLQEEIQGGTSDHPERFVAYYPNNTTAFSVIFEYDLSGNPIKCTGYDSSNNIDTYAVPEYGDNGELLRWIWYDTTGFAYDITEYTNAVRTRWINYKRNGEQNAIVEYDSTGMPIYSIWYRADGSYIVREYDEVGNETSARVFDANGVLIDDLVP